ISLVAPDEEKLLKSIERMTRQRIPDGDLMGFDLASLEAEAPEVREPRQPRGGRGGRRNDEQKPAAARGEKKPARAAGEKKAGEQKPVAEGAGKARRGRGGQGQGRAKDRKSTRLNSSHVKIS